MFQKGKTYVVIGVLNYYIGTVDQILPGGSPPRGQVGLKCASLIMDMNREMPSLVSGVFSPNIESYRFPDDTVVWLPLESLTAYFEWTGVSMSEIKTQIPESDSKDTGPGPHGGLH